jgi:transcriptional regulator with XRE-family HTH domain
VDDDSVSSAVGARVAEVRRERGLTQENLAERVGVELVTIHRIERGKVGAALERLASVAAALEVPIGTFFDGVPVPPSPWPEHEAAAAAAWRQIPEARRELALRLLAELAQ